jgi:hypothetical protein
VRAVSGAPGYDDSAAMYLTLSQAMRLHTRFALPAIDNLLDALRHAASGQPVPEAKRRILAQAEKGIRAVCRPIMPEVKAGETCWRCPPGAGDLAAMDLPHTGDGHQTYTYLLRAGFTDCAMIAATPDHRLLRIPRISERRLAAIRRVVPYGGGDD